MGNEMKKIEPKNLKKRDTTLTDQVNELCDNICKILVEFRRLNDVLSYLSPPNQKNTKEKKKNG